MPDKKVKLPGLTAPLDMPPGTLEQRIEQLETIVVAQQEQLLLVTRQFGEVLRALDNHD